MDLLAQVPMAEVFEHYDLRLSIHHQMTRLLHSGSIREFAELALGITDPRANYSAVEHGLGKKVLSNPSRFRSVFDLAMGLMKCKRPSQVPSRIMEMDIPFLKISVGSEISMLLRPREFWVANVRSVWAYLLIKHAYDLQLANEELELYRDGERSSEMNYEIWWELHRLLETSQVHLHDLGIQEAKRQNAPIGEMRFLWADAIANEIYARRLDYAEGLG